MKKKYNHNIDTIISATYVVTNKRLTLVAALGVTIGISIFIFMNSLGSGFVKKSNKTIFNNTPHIRVYKDDEISKSIITPKDTNSLVLISNPTIIPKSEQIVNPERIITLLRAQPEVTYVTPEIAVKVFYNSGMSQVSGDASGLEIAEASK
ncbi:MAG: ABC transporter permease, partial [Bacteroidia bacterium]